MFLVVTYHFASGILWDSQAMSVLSLNLLLTLGSIWNTYLHAAGTG